MRSVRSKDTGPELLIRKLVYRLGYRYRLHCKDLPGRPDLVFRARRKAIFVHGCFWHSHDCPAGRNRPSSNLQYWEPKLARNKDRDEENIAALNASGWRIMVIWECEARKDSTLTKRIQCFLES